MKFGEFAELNPSVELFSGEQYAKVMMADVTAGQRYPVEEILEEYTGGGSRFEKGDILFARITPSLEHGKIAQFRGERSDKGFGSTEFFVIRAREGISDPDYLYYLCLTEQIRKPAEKSMYGASGRQRADLDVVGQTEIDPPPIDDQKSIGGLLSSFDLLVENNLRRIEILEEMARSIYREWFVHFRFPGHEGVEMVDSELGAIPSSWSVASLSDLVDTQYGYTESTSEEPIGPKFLRGTDINKQEYIDWSQVPYCEISDEDYEKYKLSCGDVVVIRMADPGKPAIIEQDVEAVFASYLVRMTIKDQILDPYFLFYFLLSDQYQDYISGASTGTTRRSASSGVLAGAKLALPVGSLQRLFRGTVEPARYLLNTLLRQDAALREARDLLLPQLISGSIDVSNAILASKDKAKA